MIFIIRKDRIDQHKSTKLMQVLEGRQLLRPLKRGKGIHLPWIFVVTPQDKLDFGLKLDPTSWQLLFAISEISFEEIITFTLWKKTICSEIKTGKRDLKKEAFIITNNFSIIEQKARGARTISGFTNRDERKLEVGNKEYMQQ